MPPEEDEEESVWTVRRVHRTMVEQSLPLPSTVESVSQLVHHNCSALSIHETPFVVGCASGGIGGASIVSQQRQCDVEGEGFAELSEGVTNDRI